MSDSSDERLMRRIQQGDQQACRQLIEQHLPALHRFAVRLLGNDQEAEDAIQETFLRVWTRADSWQPGRAKLTTWLHTIMHNICVDSLRKNRSQNNEPLTDVHYSPQNLPSDHEIAADANRVFNALQDLPEGQRTAIILCHYQGFSNRECAEILGITVPAIESLMARGRRTLKAILIGEGA